MAEIFHDILVAPFDGLWGRGAHPAYHRGGPIWPDWDRQTAARHRVNGWLADEEPPAPASWTEIDAAQWGGPIHPHFGHMLAEFGMRILPSALNGNPAPLLFYGWPEARYRNRRNRFRASPAHFKALIDYAGLKPRRVRIELDALKVGTLSVEPQAEQLCAVGRNAACGRGTPPAGVGPSPGHLARLEAHADARLGPPDPPGPAVFVSRAGMLARFAGEAYVETVMQKAGARVIRPETLGLSDQLQIYRSGAPLIFSEGSALHVPQLLGAGLGEVAVLTRRALVRLNEASLTPRCAGLRYHDVARDMLTLLMPDGREETEAGLTLLDPDALLAGLAGQGLALARHWDQTAFAAAQEEDVAIWLNQVRAKKAWANPATRPHLAARLRRHFGNRFVLD
ncbi:MAG: hypothetical protein ACWA5A_10780 [Marinibacterium sp.]